ncbi:sigma factor [Streptomyces sp. R28]|uniref:Sigma factor n=1 Tax=Streptomyces sp. R28 TaxID=3238628 RepID=A0AB39PVI8_9ACTN
MESTGDTSVHPPADAEVHRRLVYGDESAPAEVYAAYGGLVRRVAVRVTRSAAAAEDVAQEVFAQLWSRPYAFDARRGSLRGRLSMLAGPGPGPGPGPDETVVDRERSLLPHIALRTLAETLADPPDPALERGA